MAKALSNSVGDRFGKLVITAIHASIKKKRLCTCRCDCGGTKTLRLSDLRDPSGARSCGCSSRTLSFSAGSRFGKLTVVNISPPIRHQTKPYHLVDCRCDCGGSKTVRSGNLLSGGVRSCGCMTNKSHGHTPKGVPSPTYRCWHSMLQRCYNPKATAYSYYGGSGVTVCDRWRFGEGGKSALECFIDDVGVRPNLALTIDRINNELPYAPGNVRWGTKREQGKNRRTTNLYSFEGEQLTLREIAERTGTTYEFLRHRVRRAGWSLEDTLRLPPGQGKRRGKSNGWN